MQGRELQEQVVEEHRQNVTSALKQTKSFEEKVTAGLAKVTETKEDIISQGRELKEQIEKSFKDFQTILEEQKETLLAGISEEIDRKTELITEQEEALRDQLTIVSNKVETISTTMNQGSEVLLANQGANIRKLNNVRESLQQLSLAPVERPNIGLRFHPQLLRKHLESCSCRYTLADPSKCTLDGAMLQSPTLLVGTVSTTDISLSDSEGKPCLDPQLVDGVLQSLHDGSVVPINIVSQTQNRVSICFTPETRGRHTLSVKVNNSHVANSPFYMFVYKQPEELSQPVDFVRNINPFGGLECIDDQLIVPEVDKLSVFDRTSKKKVATFELQGVSDVVVDPVTKALYASDKNSHMVHKFSAEGRHFRGVGGVIGTLPGLFNNPGGMAITMNKEGNSELFVCDVENKRIQVFDLDLNHQRVLNSTKSKLNENITFNDRGNMYIAQHSHILVTTQTGGLIQRINKPGRVKNAKGIKIFNEYLYVVNCTERGSVSVFKIHGEYVTSFGEGLLHYPQGIAIDRDGFVYVTSGSKIVYVF